MYNLQVPSKRTISAQKTCLTCKYDLLPTLSAGNQMSALELFYHIYSSANI